MTSAKFRQKPVKSFSVWQSGLCNRLERALVAPAVTVSARGPVHPVSRPFLPTQLERKLPRSTIAEYYRKKRKEKKRKTKFLRRPVKISFTYFG